MGTALLFAQQDLTVPWTLTLSDLQQRLADEYDLELLEIARQRVRRRVDPRTWDAYVATAEHGRPTEGVAARRVENRTGPARLRR